jgi:hypothetical protein
MRLRGVERSGHAVARGDQRSGVTVEVTFDHWGLSEEIPDELLAGWASADRGGVR